jgi:Molybdopterin converting factor, small subunit
MTVTVLVPGALRADSGGEGRIPVTASGTLGAVLDELARTWPRLERRIRDEQGQLRRYVNVYINGEDCRALANQDSAVPADAEIQILPSAAGG